MAAQTFCKAAAGYWTALHLVAQLIAQENDGVNPVGGLDCVVAQLKLTLGQLCLFGLA
jgi:hypothetical protein